MRKRFVLWQKFKSKLPPSSDSAALRHLNPSIEGAMKFLKLKITVLLKLLSEVFRVYLLNKDKNKL